MIRGYCNKATLKSRRGGPTFRVFTELLISAMPKDKRPRGAAGRQQAEVTT